MRNNIITGLFIFLFTTQASAFVHMRVNYMLPQDKEACMKEAISTVVGDHYNVESVTKSSSQYQMEHAVLDARIFDMEDYEFTASSGEMIFKGRVTGLSALGGVGNSNNSSSEYRTEEGVTFKCTIVKAIHISEESDLGVMIGSFIVNGTSKYDSVSDIKIEDLKIEPLTQQ